jgi:hypothetical protein
MFQARKEDSLESQSAGGHGPSRGLDAPCALKFHYRRFAAGISRMPGVRFLAPLLYTYPNLAGVIEPG